MKPISQAKIKYVQALQHKKYRNKYQTYVLEGLRACETLVGAGYLPVFAVVAENSPWVKTSFSFEIYSASNRLMTSISGLKSAPDVLGVFDIPKSIQVKDLSQTQSLTLLLDRIQDPGNLGTIIRTADWFGIKTIFLNKGCCDVYNRKTLQSAMGSHVNVQLIPAELDEIQQHLPRLRVLGLDAGGVRLSSTTTPTNESPALLIVGNEGQGLSQSYKTKCDELISIPGSHHRMAESLNASIATAIAIDRLMLG